MSFLRNTFAVLMGLLVAGLTISAGIHINDEWVTFDEFSPFDHWGKFLKSMHEDTTFFAYLLMISGVAAVFGGITTAVLVPKAKVAYALLIGFIMLFVAMLDIIIFPFHPVFYKISIFLTFFPFSWIAGKVVEVMYNRKNKSKNIENTY